ncbi:HNH endonuclease [Amycolatopsis sp. NPDC051758]|uniref:HNH endonuclease n=1 Tax=Amycolatopsis sp. NPDC051758 TaxID=3363935 RepID=UPI0037B1672C
MPDWTWDESVLACDLVARTGWGSLRPNDPRVVELSDLLQRLPIHPLETRDEKFRNANGVARKTADLATIHPSYTGKPTRGGKVDRQVVDAFMTAPGEMADAANAIRAAVELSPELFHGEPPDLDLDLEGAAAHEGRILQRLHLIRERNPKLRAKKIAQSRKQRGRVSCEACEFDFEATYGNHGRDYIECHHATPLSHSGPTVTKLDNLVLLCSNCHRMIHRKTPWLSVAELHHLVAEHKDPAT